MRRALEQRLVGAAVLSLVAASVAAAETVPIPPDVGPPRGYRCPRAEPAPRIDGELSPGEWDGAPWTDAFVDIQGPGHPAPRHAVRAKMQWDDRAFYFAAALDEPHLWATLTERDSVIYHDNDFEVFIDPDGDSHLYYELEINALGTEWDLLLVRPYRDGGPAIHAWDIPGLETAVALDGTLNDPSDTDRGWSVEIKMPWAALKEAAGVPVPPRPGDRWWVNFSRVQWRLRVEDGRYVKETDPVTGKPLPEDNWVWSPQGLIAMHCPERWGIVEFAERWSPDAPPVVPTAEDAARQALREVYYREHAWRDGHRTFTRRWRSLGVTAPRPEGWSWPPRIEATAQRFRAELRDRAGTRLTIDETGRLVKRGPR